MRHELKDAVLPYYSLNVVQVKVSKLSFCRFASLAVLSRVWKLMI